MISEHKGAEGEGGSAMIQNSGAEPFTQHLETDGLIPSSPHLPRFARKSVGLRMAFPGLCPGLPFRLPSGEARD